MITPTQKTIVVFAALTVVAAVASLWRVPHAVAPIACLGAGLMIIDAVRLLRLRPPAVGRQATVVAALRRSQRLVLVLAEGRHVEEVAVRVPWAAGGPTAILYVGRRHGAVELGFTLTPRARGRHDLGTTWLWLGSELGLWRRRVVDSRESWFVVLPDLRGPADDPLGRELERSGSSASRHGFGAQELEALRLFQSGDDVRLVDWKATARHRVPIVRELGRARRRIAWIALDAGRRMQPRCDGESKFDAAVRVAARLALAADRRGDLMGMMVYAEQPLRARLPDERRGSAAAVVRELSTIEPGDAPSDASSVWRVLAASRAPSLVVLLTEVATRLDAERLARLALTLRRARHELLVVAIGDPALEAQDAADDYARAAAALVRWDRASAIAALRNRGARVLDVTTRSAAAITVSAYLGALSMGDEAGGARHSAARHPAVL